MALLNRPRIFSKSDVTKWRCGPKTLSPIKSVIIFFPHCCKVDFSTKIDQGFFSGFCIKYFFSGFCIKYAHQFQIYSLRTSFPSQTIFFTCQRIGFIISLLISIVGLAKNPRKRLKNFVFG